MAASARILVTAAASLAMLAAPGCGKKGPPLPPEPRGPRRPGHVVVRQIGSRVVASIDVPAARGPRPSQTPVRAELVRVSYEAEPEPPADPDAFRRRGVAVGSVDADPLSPGARLEIDDR